MNTHTKTQYPGATIGMLGGGQLGRMFSFVAKRLGYRVVVLDPTPNCPSAQVCDEHIIAPFDDLNAVAHFAEQVDVITYEFENVSLDWIAAAEDIVPVYPGTKVLAASQHRLTEKQAIQHAGLPVAPFAAITSPQDSAAAYDHIGFPAVIKTTRFGYDGKGQWVVHSQTEADKAIDEANGQELIMEQLIPFQKEISVIISRSLSGDVVVYPIAENHHTNNILDTTLAPARLSHSLHTKAEHYAKELATTLDLVGTMAVEMFVVDDQTILINEIAPRPHNSGHYTIEGCITSQFENQLRAICGLPLGSTALHSPCVVMKNLLGTGTGNCLHGVDTILKDKNATLHLYGKPEAKQHRKMGHITLLADDPDQALKHINHLHQQLIWHTNNA